MDNLDNNEKVVALMSRLGTVQSMIDVMLNQSQLQFDWASKTINGSPVDEPTFKDIYLKYGVSHLQRMNVYKLLVDQQAALLDELHKYLLPDVNVEVEVRENMKLFNAPIVK